MTIMFMGTTLIVNTMIVITLGARNSDSKGIKAVKTDSIKLSYCDDCWTYYYYGYLTYTEYYNCVS